MQIKLIVKSSVQIYLNHLCREQNRHGSFSFSDRYCGQRINTSSRGSQFCNKYKQHVLQLPEMSEPIIIDGKAGKSVRGTKTPVDKTAS